MARFTEFYIPSTDKKHKLHVMEWLPDQERPRAVIQIAHGLGDHIGWYAEFAKFLTNNHFAVVGNSHLGHGLTATSADELGFFAEKDGWATAVADLHALHEIVTGRHASLPYFLFGHSMGSYLCRTYLLKYQDRLNGCILCGTGYQPDSLLNTAHFVAGGIKRIRGCRVRSSWFNSLCFSGYNKHIRPNRTESDWISRDPDVVDAIIADERCSFIPTVGLFLDIFEGMKYIQRKENIALMHKNLPLFFIGGCEDPIGGYGSGVMKSCALLINEGCRNVTMQLYPGARHKILNETNSKEVYEDILYWLQNQMIK